MNRRDFFGVIFGSAAFGLGSMVLGSDSRSEIRTEGDAGFFTWQAESNPFSFPPIGRHYSGFVFDDLEESHKKHLALHIDAMVREARLGEKPR